MATKLAILQFFLLFLLRHLPAKILTVFHIEVGQFLLSHDRTVSPCKIVVDSHDLHDLAVFHQWIWVYLRHCFGIIPITAPNQILSHKSPYRFFLFRFLMADNIRRALQNIDLGIDDAPVSLPLAVVQQAVNENRFCLMGRPLMPRKQNLRQVLVSLPRTWGMVGFVRGRMVGNWRFQFVFPLKESLETVLRRGLWSYAERMLVLQRWSPEMDPSALNFIPFWI